MFRIFIILVFAILSGPVRAQDCPDFFRFVDFGQLDRDNELYRGGTVFRAESFEGQALLRAGGTHCFAIADLAKDGRGNPVPVVSFIEYDAANTNLELQHLSILRVNNSADATTANSRPHLARLHQSGAIVRQGSNFLCVAIPDAASISCQIPSPFADNLPLVIYCDSQLCSMPVMAMNDHLVARAHWTMKDLGFAQMDLVGADILARVQAIHTFIKPLSSGL